MDVKADRKKRTLNIKKLVFEDDFKDYDLFIPEFAEKINSFGKFNNCGTIALDIVVPKRTGIILKSILN